ncbi:MAG: restriction endonuclease subunit S, partial [Oceanisphaera sp.]
MESKLPINWVSCKLGDVASVKNGFAFKSSTFSDVGIPVVRISDINSSVVSCKNSVKTQPNDQYDSFKVEYGDILIAMSGATTGKLGVYHGSNVAYQNQRVGNVRPASPDLNKSLLFYYVFNAKRQIEKKAYGGAQPNISSEKIEELKFLLPPLNEQERIVTKIEELFTELDDGIASLKTAREQLKIYRQAVLKHAFEGKLTAQWRADNAALLETPEQLLARIQQERDTRYQQQVNDWQQAVTDWETKGKEGKKPSKPKKLAVLKPLIKNELFEYPALPSGWSYVRLGALIDEPTYGTSAKCEYDTGDMGVLRIPNVKNGVVDDSDLKFASFGIGEVDHLALNKGDLLTIRSNGSVSLVGSCALIKEKDIRNIFAGYLIRLRANQHLILPAFLLAVLSSHLLRKQIEAVAKSTSGVNNINTGELQGLIIPLPSIEEQQELLKHLDVSTPSINVTELEIDNQLLKSETLRQTILKKDYSGQLFE